LARDNMGLDFVSDQYGNAHVLICIYNSTNKHEHYVTKYWIYEKRELVQP
jgi:hypothetical protein